MGFFRFEGSCRIHLTGSVAGETRRARGSTGKKGRPLRLIMNSRSERPVPLPRTVTKVTAAGRWCPSPPPPTTIASRRWAGRWWTRFRWSLASVAVPSCLPLLSRVHQHVWTVLGEGGKRFRRKVETERCFSGLKRTLKSGKMHLGQEIGAGSVGAFLANGWKNRNKNIRL